MVAGRAEWGSDVVVEMMQAYGIPYAFTNLGGTFRGLLDSIVNFGENKAPQTIECLHEEIAVSIANGYAKVTGRPAVALVHNVVGTMHASMSMYDAYVAKTPLIVMSGTGPMALSGRRPSIDWVHTALVQGNLVRDYVKFDDQPFDTASFPESFMRAHRVASTEPLGPTYIALDAGWQEEQLVKPLELPDVSKYAAPTRLQGEPAALRRTAELLANAELPLILTGRPGRNREAVAALVDLAEAGGIAVIDSGGGPLNFPNTHRLDATDTDLLGKADVVLLLDVDQAEQALTARGRYPRLGGTPRVRTDVTLINLGIAEIFIRSTALDFGRLYPTDLDIAADSSVALPELTARLRTILEAKSDRADILRRREARVAEAREAAASKIQGELEKELGKRPITHAQIAQSTWNVIKDEKWIVSGGLGPWLRRLWTMDRPGCTGGGGGAAAVGTRMPNAIGAALAARDEGGFGVSFTGDGDLFYVPSALWTAVHHHIPMLAFVLNNNGYQGEGGHIVYTSQQRERSTANRHVAIDIPGFSITGLARAQGAYAEGPIEDPAELEPAIRRAFQVMKEQSTLAVIDVVCD